MWCHFLLFIDLPFPFLSAISQAENAVVCTWNIDKQRPSTPDLLHHHQLLHMIDGYNSASGVDVAGHRGYFLRGVGVLLNQALINYGLQFLMSKQCR